MKAAPVKFGDEDRASFIASVLARAELVEAAIHGARLLWVDDHPEHNNDERRVLTRLGIVCDLALTNDQAVRMAADGSYDLVISDMARDAPQDGGTQAGEALIAALRGRIRAGSTTRSRR